ncbi:MAG: macro domain-containing protein [bacterium]|nr:macro domain-containing protein [bacterium]
MKIELHKENILNATTDAIVNPANSQGVMGGGVAAAIKTAGGVEIEKEAVSHQPCAVGAAYITTAGELPFKGIIHAPTMEHPAEPIPAKQVELATVAALRAADEAGYNSVAFPGMGTGIGDVNVEVAAKIMIETIQMYMVDNQLVEVHLYALDDDLFSAFEKLIS